MVMPVRFGTAALVAIEPELTRLHGETGAALQRSQNLRQCMEKMPGSYRDIVWTEPGLRRPGEAASVMVVSGMHQRVWQTLTGYQREIKDYFRQQYGSDNPDELRRHSLPKRYLELTQRYVEDIQHLLLDRPGNPRKGIAPRRGLALQG